MAVPIAAAFCVPMMGISQELGAAQTYALLDSRLSDEVSRVKISFDVQGHLQSMQLPGAEQGGKKAPLRVAARLMYDELLAPESLARSRERVPAARYYHQARAQLGIEAGRQESVLREDRRLVVARPESGGLTLYSAEGPLTREELDLMDVPGSSYLVYALLPKDRVQIGQSWEPDGQLLAGLARVESVTSCQLKCTLGAVQSSVARVRVEGTIRGRGAGAETELRIAGEYRYALRQQRATWLQLTIEENRSAGHTMPGLQVKADFRMLVTPSQEAGPLDSVDWSQLLAVKGPGSELLQLAPDNGGLQLTLDRRWHVMSDSSDGLVLRFVDGGDLLAQCNISSLATLPAGKQVGLEEFQQDVRRAIGERFVQFEHASQEEDEQGRRLLRIAAVGQVEDVPIRWVYYHISNREGRRAAQVFTMEAELAERLGEADQMLVGGVQFAQQQPPQANRSAAVSSGPPAKASSAATSSRPTKGRTGASAAAARR